MDDICAVCVYVYHKIYIRIVPCTVSATIIYKKSSSKKRKKEKTKQQIRSPKNTLMEKEMATHSSVLAWRIPGTGEPHGLLSMGSHRVGHDWSDLAVAAARIHWRGQQRMSGWMASWTRWTWVCTSSGRWWWTGKPGVLQSMGSQRVGHDWVTELKWGTFLKLMHAFASPLLSSPNLPSPRNTLKYWKNTQHWAITEQSREAAQFWSRLVISQRWFLSVPSQTLTAKSLKVTEHSYGSPFPIQHQGEWGPWVSVSANVWLALLWRAHEWVQVFSARPGELARGSQRRNWYGQNGGSGPFGLFCTFKSLGWRFPKGDKATPDTRLPLNCLFSFIFISKPEDYRYSWNCSYIY